MSDCIKNRLSLESKVAIEHLEILSGWMRSTIVECKTERGSHRNAARELRKFIADMRNPGTLENFEELLAELESHDISY